MKLSSILGIAREGTIIVSTAVAFLACPLLQAAPLPQPTAGVPVSSGPADAAKAGLPFAVPGIGIGVAGGIMLAHALGAAALAGTAVTVGAVALPVVLIAAGIGLLAWGSWRAWKALTASRPSEPPRPPTATPGGRTPGGSTTGPTTNPGTTTTPTIPEVHRPPLLDVGRGSSGGLNVRRHAATTAVPGTTPGPMTPSSLPHSRPGAGVPH